jgi:hypothetical protein
MKLHPSVAMMDPLERLSIELDGDIAPFVLTVVADLHPADQPAALHFGGTVLRILGTAVQAAGARLVARATGASAMSLDMQLAIAKARRTLRDNPPLANALRRHAHLLDEHQAELLRFLDDES